MIALDGSFLDRPVHAFHLPICPGMLHFGETMFDFIFMTNTIKDMDEGVLILLAVGKLDTIIRQERMDFCKAQPQRVCAKTLRQSFWFVSHAALRT